MEVGQYSDDSFENQPQDIFSLLSEESLAKCSNGFLLYGAALKGDWKTARKLHSKHPNCFAAVARSSNIVVYFMKLCTEIDATNDLASIKNTSLCLALASGTVTVARERIRVQPELPLIRSHKGLTPFHMATLLGHREMVRYLLPLTLEYLSNKDLVDLFISTIKEELYDISFQILNNRPELALYDNEEAPLALQAMAKSQSLKSNGSRRGHRLISIWSYCCNFFKRIGSRKENDLQLFKALLLVVRLWDEVLRHRRDCNNVPKLMSPHPWKLLFTAVEVGNVEFVTTILSSYPDLIWKLNDEHQSILHVAVQYRREKIFRLVLEIDVVKDLLAICVNDSNGNNILHLVGLLSPDVCYGLRPSNSAFIVMHREMLWFKAIEDLVQPHLALARNFDEETPRTLFTKEHQKLKKHGEYWIVDTANLCITLAILVTFVVLIAALRSFVKPFSHGAWHWVFAIFDSMSLLSSIASIFVFSSILTSNFAEEDFLHSLPRKLMVGLTLLIISIATLVIALAATLPFIFEFGWLYLGISGLACLPIIVFAGSDLPGLLEAYPSTIECNFIFKPQHHQLFQ
ncbi:uncharacterized protein LOC110727793 [Chenopodium quinoa]|uniref:uncharacterized protein LOC110727793 n=1 Tax=Chenopodium quinoa TaxID=63459 RepID=UPI000B77A299|nr:uncharacterized protein LOC110727793 [Chenopodium quinoa]